MRKNNKTGKKDQMISYFIYRFCGKWIPFLFLILMIVAVCFDFSKQPYISQSIEKLFQYDMVNVIPVTIGIWAFTTALIIFSIGKFDECRYGVRMIESLTATFGMPCLILQGMVVIIEIVMLTISSMYKIPILFWTVTWIELCTMGCGILMVLFEMSRTKFYATVEKEYDLLKRKNRKQGKKQKSCIDGERIRCEQRLNKIIQKKESCLLIKMTLRLDYSSEMERDALMKIIKKVAVDKIDILWVLQLADNIFIYSKKKDDAIHLLREWFLYNDTSLETKKGITAMFIFGELENEIWHYEEFIEWEENDEQRRNIYIWCMLCNAYLLYFENQEWRVMMINKIKTFLKQNWTKMDEKEAIEDMEILDKFPIISEKNRKLEETRWAWDYIFLK